LILFNWLIPSGLPFLNIFYVLDTYVMHKYDHPMVEGHSKKVLDQVKSMVEEEASRTLGATTSAIPLTTSKTFLLKHLLNEDGEGLVEVLKDDKLCQVMDKFIALSSPNVHNLVTSFKH